MGAASRYWTLVRLDIAGGYKVEVIRELKAFFSSVFLTGTGSTEVSDQQIQRQLQQWSKSPPAGESEKAVLAERCLLCFISHYIEQVCRQLETQFGANHGFSCQDLLPFVLSEDGRFHSQKNSGSRTYQSVSATILASFDPEQSSLSTWTTRRVKHHPELNAFLLERGVYLVSDWAILNDTRPKQLEKILTDFYHLTLFEVKQFSQLLECYHAIYRVARLQGRAGGSRRQCQAPTSEQLQQIAQGLGAKTGQLYSQKLVMSLLQQLATRLRNYRIYVRGGGLQTEVLDPADEGNLANRMISPQPLNSAGEQDEQIEFLEFYRQQFSTCLDRAIYQVTDSWVKQFRRQSEQKSAQFLTALQLFHCQGKTMGEIAVTVGLQAQYQVTRLLKLKSFRSDVRHELLGLLREQIQSQVKTFLDPTNLAEIDQKIEVALDEQITTVIQEAESEASLAKNRPTASLFARKLCHHLDQRLI